MRVITQKHTTSRKTGSNWRNVQKIVGGRAKARKARIQNRSANVKPRPPKKPKQQFCPNCKNMINFENGVCPNCKFNTASPSFSDTEAKV